MKSTQTRSRQCGVIFNIQRFSVHDGPGIRTTVFFKGCNLSCLWCHNPESISPQRQIEFNQEKCIGCGRCFEVCPQDAHYLDENGQHQIDRSRCNGCFRCARECYAQALVGVGESIGVSGLMEAIVTDIPYFEASRQGGGVTFSGGEPMLQEDFLRDVLHECKKLGIHTAVDTAGHVSWQSFEKILPLTDLILYDIKAIRPQKHRELTGVDNQLILANLKKLRQFNVDLLIRVPLIVGHNDDEMDAISQFLKENDIRQVEIIPYHKLGESKYEALDRENRTENLQIPADEQVKAVITSFREAGLDARQS